MTLKTPRLNYYAKCAILHLVTSLEKEGSWTLRNFVTTIKSKSATSFSFTFSSRSCSWWRWG